MTALLLVAPLVGGVVALGARWMGAVWAARSGVAYLGLAAVCAAGVAGEVLGAVAGVGLAPLELGGVLRLELGADAPGAVLALVVAGVAFGVGVYSLWYLEADPALPTFIAMVAVFSGAMGWVALGASPLALFVGWEGIGVASYLLIAYWNTRGAAVGSALQAFLLNRVGDTLLTLGLAVLIAGLGGLSFGGLGAVGGISAGWGLGLLLLGAAAGKSAQLGLHAWLPNAMEAPTPVSALIHAATLVTAGVFLLLRCAPLTGEAGVVVATLGAATTLFAGVTGLTGSDMKRVIAYSTCSQVALMTLAVGAGLAGPGLALLALHAAYKAALFLGAGLAIHALGGWQDLRAMGGLGGALPYAAGAMGVAGAALCALPYTSGEYGKDLVVEGLAGGGAVGADALWWAALLSVGLTAAYSVRLHRLAFGGAPRWAPSLGGGLDEGHTSRGALAVVGGLAALSLVGGWLTSGVLGPLAPTAVPGLPLSFGTDAEFAASGWVMSAPLLAGGLGLAVGLLPLGEGPMAAVAAGARAGAPGWNALSAKGAAGVLRAAGAVAFGLDRGLLEAAGPHGVSGLALGGAARGLGGLGTGVPAAALGVAFGGLAALAAGVL